MFRCTPSSLDETTARIGPALPGENLAKLVELMKYLRSPQGCPWDRAQDYDSVKGLLLEEVYEVVDAVNARDFGALEEELGDLLFQVVFYSRLAEEEGRFDLGQVIERVHAKLVRRHPHVFGEVRAPTPEEALQSWTAVKERERAAHSKNQSASGSILDGIAPTLPSTLEAYELGLRASEAGFNWKKAEDLLDKIEEEVREVRLELPLRREENGRRLEEEVGDLLFAVANLTRLLRSDPESCLRRANRKFRRRFQTLEDQLAQSGKRLRDCSPEDLNTLWDTIKTRKAE